MGLLAVADVAISLSLLPRLRTPEPWPQSQGPGSECEEPAGNGVGFMERRLSSIHDTDY